MTEHKLEVNRIRKQFGEKEILSDISFYVDEGELVTLLGPSGCGKSTIMNILTGILEADAGGIRVEGKVGYMQQKDLLLPWKTCMENVILPDLLNVVHIFRLDTKIIEDGLRAKKFIDVKES